MQITLVIKRGSRGEISSYPTNMCYSHLFICTYIACGIVLPSIDGILKGIGNERQQYL